MYTRQKFRKDNTSFEPLKKCVTSLKTQRPDSELAFFFFCFFWIRNHLFIVSFVAFVHHMYILFAVYSVWINLFNMKELAGFHGNSSVMFFSILNITVKDAWKTMLMLLLKVFVQLQTLIILSTQSIRLSKLYLKGGTFDKIKFYFSEHF